MIKDMFEDYKRHKRDDKENDQKSIVYNPKTGTEKEITWKQI